MGNRTIIKIMGIKVQIPRSQVSPLRPGDGERAFPEQDDGDKAFSEQDGDRTFPEQDDGDKTFSEQERDRVR